MNKRKSLLCNTLLLAIAWGMPPASARQIPPLAPAETGHPPDTTATILTGQRVMQTFDFEERNTNYLDLPMYWHKVVGRDGFPHYSTAVIDSTHHRSGRYSFKLIPDGGSVAYEYDTRRIPVKAGSDFQVTGYVHLENVHTCRARITCALTDRRGVPIPGSEHASQLVGPDQQGLDGWVRLEVYVPGNFPDARYITVTVQALQEQQWNEDKLSTARIPRSDVKALVWFDDITIYQLPRVVLRIIQPGNVFDSDESPELQVEVDGVSSLDYQVHLTVHNTDAESVHDESWILSGIEGATRIRKIELPQLAAGLYHARLNIISANRLVASRKLTFAKLAPMNTDIAGSGGNFGLLLLDKAVGPWATAVNLTRLANAKLIKLPVWRHRPDQPNAMFSEKNFDRKLIQLNENNIQLIATFSEIPDELVRKTELNSRSLLDVLSMDADIWRPQVAYVLAQYAHQVPYWQIGGDFEVRRQSWDPRIRPVIDKMKFEFDKLVRNTILTVPLNSLFQVNKSQLGTSHPALVIPSSISPHHIGDYLQDARRRNFRDIWVTLETLDPDRYTREHLLTDFAKRLVYAKKGGAQSIFINHPWLQREYNARFVTEPTEQFLIFRTLADQLGGTRYVGSFDLATGIPALIFDRNGTGCIFTWNDNYNSDLSPDRTQPRLYLGDNPVQIDLFGNRQKLPSRNGLTQLNITRWPVVITGIDTRLAQLRATLQLDPPVVEASIAQQQIDVKFVNPFNTPVSGRLRFRIDEKNNQNWSIDPLAFNFFLHPHETFRQPIIVKTPRNEPAGKKRLNAYLTLDSDRSYNILVDIPFEIRLTDVDFNIFTRRLNSSDLYIQQVVTNLSDDELTLHSFIDLPDSDRLERAIPRLQPGLTVTKTFFIPDAAQWLGQYLRIGLYDPKGTKRINYYLQIN